MRKCPSCDSEVSILAERCRFCGKSLPKEAMEGETPKAKSSRPSAGGGRNLWKIVIFVLLGGVLLFRLATLVMSESHVFKKGPSPAKPELEKPALSSADTAAGKPAEKIPEAVTPAEEPNFISVNGKVIPNPKKRSSQPSSLGPPAPSSSGEEPNFISVNGKVIPNPKKQRNPAVA